MSVIVIVGSRDYPRLDLVLQFVDALPPETIVVSGAARGVDTVAARRARERGLYVQELPVHSASWTSHGRAAGPIRNRLMVKLGDGVVAFWNWRSPGSWTIGSPAQCFSAFPSDETEERKWVLLTESLVDLGALILEGV